MLGLDSVYNLELSQLYQIFYQTIKRAKELSEEETIREVKVEKDTYSLEDMIISLSRRLHRGECLYFRELLVAIENEKWYGNHLYGCFRIIKTTSYGNAL